MRIKSLEIFRYKSILQPFSLKEAGRLHLFIGSNNSGKTNILDSIYQLCNENRERFYDKNAFIRVTFTLQSLSGNELIATTRGSVTTFSIDGVKISHDQGVRILNKHLIRIRATNPIVNKKMSIDFRDFRINFPKQFNLFLETLNRYLPKISISDFIYNKNSITEENQIMHFERLGDGFRQVFCILMYLFHPRYTILLLEEPEIHLHPALVKRLLKIIEHENFEYQVFLTTHSPLFIHTKNLHRLFRVTREGESTIVYSPRLQGVHLSYGRLMQELNADNTEMFFADTVLLVEGPSDHILMRTLIDNFYRGDKDIKVIQTYGKTNMDVYVELLKVFNIPRIVMLDRDALYDSGIKIIQKVIENNFTDSEDHLIAVLKKYGIFILSNGSIEKNYPRKYQRRRKHKPQNALYAASRITEIEFQSKTMRYLREIIERL